MSGSISTAMKAIAIELIALYLRSLDTAAAGGVETMGRVPGRYGAGVGKRHDQPDERS